MSLNIAETLARSAEDLGGQTGLIEAATGKSLTFAELHARSDSYAHIIRDNGIGPGDRVMLMVKPSADFICLTFGLFKVGAPVILIDPGMGYKSLLRCIGGVRPHGFIGIPRAHLFRKLFRKPFVTVEKSFCCGNSLGLFGADIRRQSVSERGSYPVYEPGEEDLAAIIFTTGSTGPPKGVRYEHSIFHAQLRLIRDYYEIGPGQVDQPAFPLFALFSTALGATAVIPDMDPTRPARVDPARFVSSIEKYGVSYSFASPALWRVIGDYCPKRDQRMKSVEKVLMAGAPVSGVLIERMQRILPQGASIHTPYGATESLPIVSIEGREIAGKTWELTRKGRGTCVGRALPGIEIAILPISDRAIGKIDRNLFLSAGEIGEIIVRGDVVTRAYENNERENVLAKIPDGDTFWHRMGDVGYLDEEGRFWFCGRRAHRVVTEEGRTFFTIPCEALFNEHPQVFRSALVGVTAPGDRKTVPAIVIEPEKETKMSAPQLLAEVKNIGRQNALTADIGHYLLHSDFPVDIRHNAKIFREKLAVWASSQLEGEL